MALNVTLLGALAAAGMLEITPIADRNAMTLPAQRHIVRMELDPGRPAAWLLALQKAGEEGHGLAFYRSDDEAKSWRYYADIQPDFTHTDRADLLPVGDDIALVWSFEAPDISGSNRHDVYFQWWRRQPGTADWVPDPAVRVFDSTSSRTGYVRAELARDSLGRIWVQAFELTSDGDYDAVIAVSSDDGRSFAEQPTLDTLDERGGGRLLSLGDTLLFLYDMHHDSEHPAWFRLRRDDWPLDQWTEVEPAFAEGIYHGAALSAVADGSGGMHLVYKEKLGMLLYRHFDGERFGEPILLEKDGNWAVQPAITRVDDRVYVFYNRPRSSERFDLVVRSLAQGSMSEAQVLDDDASFKGYPAAVELLPPDVARVPCLFGLADGSRKSVIQVHVEHRVRSAPDAPSR